jgi:2-polyprenyl-6-methoxyphenol hydroxylase-like FAD-dependent oxidoreductase
MGDAVEDIVIAGAGLAGLATALGLHRQALPTYSPAQAQSAVAVLRADGRAAGLVSCVSCRVVQERGEVPGAGVVAGAARVGVRVHHVDQRLPRPGCPRRRGQDPGAPFALRAVSRQQPETSLREQIQPICFGPSLKL